MSHHKQIFLPTARVEDRRRLDEMRDYQTWDQNNHSKQHSYPNSIFKYFSDLLYVNI